MKSDLPISLRHYLLVSAAILCAGTATPALAQNRFFDVPAMSSGAGVAVFARQAQVQLLISDRDARGRRTNEVKGALSIEQALKRLLDGTGLTYRQNGARTYVVVSAGVGASALPAAALAASGTIGDRTPIPVPTGRSETAPLPDPSQDIIVTAQKRRESIQSVPIAVSAFTAKSLDDQKIEGGSELLRAVPNVTFSKSNFASYNFSIRGIGTKALSVTSDPAVAVSFNNSPLLRNRLFEQEYFDVERVEVLRGPQGTLYGRNATAGVVNMIPVFAKTGEFEGSLKLEGGNYGSMRVNGMLNVPLTDTLAIRGAGAWTTRQGYDFNTVTNRDVNGRNLWGTRATATWEPGSRFKATFAWEHFSEDDDRSRTGKQLCHTDPGPNSIRSANIANLPAVRGELSQGCADGSLYDDGAYGVPNGLSLPYVTAPAGSLFMGYKLNGRLLGPAVNALNPNIDPYAGVTQSRDLRTIATTYDPTFRAKNDVFQFNAEFSVTPDIKIYSQSVYDKDYYFSTQDYNRFQSNDVFNDSTGLVNFVRIPFTSAGLTPGGVFTDPQLGASKKIVGIDMVRSNSEQWYQEFRIQSSFKGPLNFSFGTNYLNFKIDEDYYLFNNLFTLSALGLFDSTNSAHTLIPCVNPTDSCVYVDPNRLDSINGQGHNYFRSRNLAKTESLAAFGELYWEATANLKLTAGLRYTKDKKTATPVPTQLLLGPGFLGSGFVSQGYPELPDIVQKWGRLTGRLVVDWRPQLGFTDNTLLYASYSRGYKGGGANPSGIGANPAQLQFSSNPTTFKPETVDAFEVGMKNTLAGGALTLNADAFFYKYKNYQVSQIVDRMALNENFDADIWGAEFEAAWRPTSRIRLNANIGYLGTRIAEGMKSIDVMNRTQGNADWAVVKPWVQLASNCIAPKALVEKVLNSPFFAGNPVYLFTLCGASYAGDYKSGSLFPTLMGFTYDPATDAPNQGRGFYADLSGKELPNSPHWTVNLGAQYTLPIGDWGLTLRGDYYRQGKSWARVYNDAIDRLKAWDNVNLSLTLERPKDGFAIQFYVKNVFNKTPITDAYLNSDDTGLTANVFTLDPRIFALSMSKKF